MPASPLMHPVAAPVLATPEAVTLNQVEAFLGDLGGHLAAPADARARPRGRPPILPGLLRWSGLLVCLRRGATTPMARWRWLTSPGWWPCPRLAIRDDAIDQRWASDGPAARARLVADLTARLIAWRDRLVDRPLVPWASEVLAIDHTTRAPVARRLPSRRAVPAGDGPLLPGTLAAVFDRRRPRWRRIDDRPDPPSTSKSPPVLWWGAGRKPACGASLWAIAPAPGLTSSPTRTVAGAAAGASSPAPRRSIAAIHTAIPSRPWSGGGNPAPIAPRPRCGWSRAAQTASGAAG